MAYLITFLLLFISPTTLQASTPDGVMCSEVRETLMEFVQEGSMTMKQADRIVDRCIAYYEPYAEETVRSPTV